MIRPVYQEFNQEIARLLQNDSVAIMPSDTVYGLFALASSPVAVRRLYSLKLRENKPGTLLAARVKHLTALGIDKNQINKAANYWPGPVSVIISCESNMSYLHLGKDSLAVRIPDNKELINLIELTGPLMSTSANPPGKAEANTVKQAQDYFGDTVDFYVDGGDLSGRKPSTIIKLTNSKVEVIRQGAVKIDPKGKVL